MEAAGYESWFVSARDPISPRALWIRHTRHRPRVGPGSVALWCTVIDRDGGQQPAVVKEVLAAFPPGTAAGPGQFGGHAAMAGHHARWDLAVTGEQGPLRPLRPGPGVCGAGRGQQHRAGRVPGRFCFGFALCRFRLRGAEALGISLKPEVLPLSNLAGYLPPFWLSPHLAMRRK
jgi:hypothetical protein